MRLKAFAVILSIAFGTTVQSAIITYIYQDGDDVRVYATGTVNLDAFSSVGGGDVSSSAYDDSRVNWQGISNSATGEIKILQSDDYSGVTQLGSPLSGINNIGTYTGSRFAFWADFQHLQVAPNYVSGGLINSYAVYTNTLLSNMGIYQTNMSGTWTYNGVSETVNVLVGTTPPSDPVPDTGSTAALLGAGVAALAFARRRLG